MWSAIAISSSAKMATASPSAGAVMLTPTVWMAVMRRNVTVVVRNAHIANAVMLKTWVHLAAYVSFIPLSSCLTVMFQWVDTAPWMSSSATTLFVNPWAGSVMARTTVATTQMRIPKSAVRIFAFQSLCGQHPWRTFAWMWSSFFLNVSCLVSLS